MCVSTSHLVLLLLMILRVWCLDCWGKKHYLLCIGILNQSDFKITLIRLSKVASCQWKSPHTWLRFMQPAILNWLSTSLKIECLIKFPWNRSHLLKTVITRVCLVQCKFLCNFNIASTSCTQTKRISKWLNK